MPTRKDDDSVIQLAFKRSGGAYARAVEVANFMDMDIETYLLRCIKEGHKVLQQRMDRVLESPTFLRNEDENPTTVDY